MSEDDGFVRITLRIPKEMHQRLNDAAAKKRSMNAEIIARLEETFEMDDYEPKENVHTETDEELVRHNVELMRELREKLDILNKKLGLE